MRKVTALLLSLVLVCSLFGCTGNAQDQHKNSTYSLSDLLVFKAHAYAQQIGMQADQGYMTAAAFPEAVVAAADVFHQAATAEPVSAKVATDIANTVVMDVTSICAQFEGYDRLAACSSLTVSDEIFVPQKFVESAAVYLRYSENCQFIVVFTPRGDGLAAVWAYPLYPDAAERVQKTYFSNSRELDADQIRAACKSSAKADFQATYTGQKTSPKFYSQLATNLFKACKPLDADTVSNYTSDGKLISNVVNLSKQMVSGPQRVQVFRFPAKLEGQVEEILRSTAYGPQLEAYTRQMVYLTFPRQICARYGVEWISTASLLTGAMQTGTMGAVATEEDVPVLVLMQFKDGICLLMSLYPSQHNIYLYQYAVLPQNFQEVSNLLSNMGASILR